MLDLHLLLNMQQVQCFDYLFRTAELNNLPLQRGDNILMNFGLHDYNLGEAGVPEYAAEYVRV